MSVFRVKMSHLRDGLNATAFFLAKPSINAITSGFIGDVANWRKNKSPGVFYILLII
jgi:hypothetical protein